MTLLRGENEWIRRIPKVELHRHLQGSIRTSTILDIGRRYNIRLPGNTERELEHFVKHKKPAKNLLDFLKPWDLFIRIVVNSEVVSRITYEAIQDAASDNIEYLELRFAPYTMSNNMKLRPRETLDAVTAAVRDAERDFHTIVKLVLGIARVNLPHYFQYNVHILEAAEDYRDFVVGFDLAGDEANYPPRLYVDFFWLVREHDFKITVHAGEAAESKSVRDAIELLGANRIGHGFNALNDPDVIDLFVYSPQQQSPIPVEICPTSAYLTGTLRKNQVIPSIRRFLDYGVPVTISADNPQVCNTTLSNEFEWLRKSRLLSLKEIFRILTNAIEYSFASQDIKAGLHQSIKNIAEKINPDI